MGRPERLLGPRPCQSQLRREDHWHQRLAHQCRRERRVRILYRVQVFQAGRGVLRSGTLSVLRPRPRGAGSVLASCTLMVKGYFLFFQWRGPLEDPCRFLVPLSASVTSCSGGVAKRTVVTARCCHFVQTVLAHHCSMKWCSLLWSSR